MRTGWVAATGASDHKPQCPWIFRFRLEFWPHRGTKHLSFLIPAADTDTWYLPIPSSRLQRIISNHIWLIEARPLAAGRWIRIRTGCIPRHSQYLVLTIRIGPSIVEYDSKSHLYCIIALHSSCKGVAIPNSASTFHPQYIVQLIKPLFRPQLSGVVEVRKFREEESLI